MTPAMQQFHEVKSQYQDHIVLFRMGDFYETFYDDAKRASEILNITLTARDKERKVPMAGIPFHALDNYLSKLVEEGQKVVIVEQLEDPSQAKGVVKRGVVKIVTPGTSTLEKDLKNANYLVALYAGTAFFDISFLDLVEGTIYTAQFDSIEEAQDNILILNPKEILISHEQSIHTIATKDFWKRISGLTTNLEGSDFDVIKEPSSFPESIITSASTVGFKSIHAILNYLTVTQRSDIRHVNKIIKLTTSSRMALDANAIRNLELIEGNRKGSLSLYSLMDKCSTTSGSKKLKLWIISPLLDLYEIQQRNNSIQALKNEGPTILDSIDNSLRGIYDLSRISSKVGLGTVNARDLRNMILSIKGIFDTIQELKLHQLSPRLDVIIQEIEEEIQRSNSALSRVDHTITMEPPLAVREGGMIQVGINADLDTLHELKSGSKTWLREFEQSEIKRSGISTLKVRFNKVFGYYIEVSKGQSAKVPDYFIRKQTLVNAERYITPELKEQEANILGAEDRIGKLEYEIFMELLKEVNSIIPSLQKINDLIAEIDVYKALALCAIEYSWTKPEVQIEGLIQIDGGRHPVIEFLQKREGKSFVSNGVGLKESCSLQIITGPNMGGKSTFLRQVALIVLLAQIGSFVPAEKAEISLVDRIFTRVGASDNLSQGESTFMVEMLETAEILRHATQRSLVILDEVGRGTSTFDGMSIAWAICEHLQRIGAKTLFATHYHELTELANKYTNVKNLSVKVIDYQGEVVLMHQIIEGKADKSYGIHVAKLAKLPTEVVRTAENILRMLEKEKNKLSPKPQDLFSIGEEGEGSLESANNTSELLNRLNAIDINQLTPIEAMQKLSELKQLVKK